LVLPWAAALSGGLAKVHLNMAKRPIHNLFNGLLQAQGMTMLRRLLLSAASLLALATAAPPALAQIRNEQDRARQDLAAGHVRSLREIEARVLPMMRGAISRA
jgi:hypothetical protein